MKLLSAQRPAAFDFDRSVLRADARAEFGERDFGMVACCHGLVHLRCPAGMKPGEQHGGFHLCARDRHGKRNRRQRAAPDFQRKVIVVPRLECCAEPA